MVRKVMFICGKSSRSSCVPAECVPMGHVKAV